MAFEMRSFMCLWAALTGASFWRRATLSLLISTAAASASCSDEHRSARDTPDNDATFQSKLLIVPGLAEPLVRTKPTSQAEDNALLEATMGRNGEQEPLLAFLSAHPDSGWNAAIHTNLGLAYYRG